MNEAAETNLDWFWREWFLEAPTFDQTIDSVVITMDRDVAHATVRYGNKQRGVMPLLVRFTFADSTTQEFSYPAEIWKAGERYTVSYTFPGKTIRQIWIDPDRHFVDVDRTNNRWIAK
jgi:hypothetical protein